MIELKGTLNPVKVLEGSINAVPVGLDEKPFFDLASAGLPAITLDGVPVELETDTAKILAAVSKCTVVFKLKAILDREEILFDIVGTCIHSNSVEETASIICPVVMDELGYVLLSIYPNRVTAEFTTHNTLAGIKALEDAVDGIWAELNYKEIDITKFTNSAAGTHEIGSVIGTVTLTWELNKEPASQTLNGASLDATVRTKEFKSVSTAQTYSLKVTDERGATDTASSSVNFYNGVYYGVLTDGAEINSAALLAMSKKLQNSRTVTFTDNAGPGQRHAYAIPNRSPYGTPTFKDAETGFQAGFYLAKTFEFTNGSGYTEEYNVWLSTNPALGSMTVAVS